MSSGDMPDWKRSTGNGVSAPLPESIENTDTLFDAAFAT